MGWNSLVLMLAKKLDLHHDVAEFEANLQAFGELAPSRYVKVKQDIQKAVADEPSAALPDQLRGRDTIPTRGFLGGLLGSGGRNEDKVRPNVCSIGHPDNGSAESVARQWLGEPPEDNRCVPVLTAIKPPALPTRHLVGDLKRRPRPRDRVPHVHGRWIADVEGNRLHQEFHQYRWRR